MGNGGLEQFDLADNTKLIIKDNVLAVISEKGLKTVSSAIYNGGYKQVKAVLNVACRKATTTIPCTLTRLN